MRLAVLPVSPSAVFDAGSVAMIALDDVSGAVFAGMFDVMLEATLEGRDDGPVGDGALCIPSRIIIPPTIGVSKRCPLDIPFCFMNCLARNLTRKILASFHP